MYKIALKSRALMRCYPALLRFPRATKNSFNTIPFTAKLNFSTPRSDGSGGEGKADKLADIEVIDINWEDNVDEADDEDEAVDSSTSQKQDADIFAWTTDDETKDMFGGSDENGTFKYVIRDDPAKGAAPKANVENEFARFTKWAEKNAYWILPHNANMKIPSKGADYADSLKLGKFIKEEQGKEEVKKIVAGIMESIESMTRSR